ncbi:hypothetical protein AOLI_G00046980 [Acnodon oligacanthus]
MLIDSPPSHPHLSARPRLSHGNLRAIRLSEGHMFTLSFVHASACLLQFGLVLYSLIWALTDRHHNGLCAGTSAE